MLRGDLTGQLAFHAAGTVHVTGTLRGVFTADLLPVDGTPDITGRYTVWFGSNGAITETVQVKLGDRSVPVTVYSGIEARLTVPTPATPHVAPAAAIEGTGR